MLRHRPTLTLLAEETNVRKKRYTLPAELKPGTQYDFCIVSSMLYSPAKRASWFLGALSSLSLSLFVSWFEEGSLPS